jgi:hypothetical protein
MTSPKLAIAAACVLALLVSGCATKPPLPKRASLERVPRPAATTDYNGLVAGADVLYFPRERVGATSRSEPAALLLDALVQSGVPVAIAWDTVDAGQQPILDQLQTLPPGEREPLIAQLELAGTGRAREHARATLRDPRLTGARHLAVRFPAALAAKFSTGEPLSADERRLLPAGFSIPAGGAEAHAERLAAERADADLLANSYRFQVLRQQFAAEQIVRHFRSAGGGGKLLVFAQRDDLLSGHGVPDFVAQKLTLRQVVMESSSAPRKLLTRADGNVRHDLQIVNRAPAAAGD